MQITRKSQFSIFILLFIIGIIEQTQTKRGVISSFYSNDKTLEYATNILTQQSFVQKKTCKNDQTYHYLEIGLPQQKNQTKFQAIIMCNIHARQLLVSQVCLQWTKNLIYKRKDLLNHINFRVFYRANNMRDSALTLEGECERKNKNHVDLNRNFPTQFNYYNATQKDQIYSGPYPFSEPFTICLKGQIENKRLDYFLDIHTGQIAFYHQQGINFDKQTTILKKLNQTFPQIKLQKITTLNLDKQAINGHIFADLKVRMKVPFTMLFEIYDNNKVKSNDSHRCFKQFNPSTQEQMKSQQKKWSKVITMAVQEVLASLNQSNSIQTTSV